MEIVLLSAVGAASYITEVYFCGYSPPKILAMLVAGNWYNLIGQVKIAAASIIVAYAARPC